MRSPRRGGTTGHVTLFVGGKSRNEREVDSVSCPPAPVIIIITGVSMGGGGRPWPSVHPAPGSGPGPDIPAVFIIVWASRGGERGFSRADSRPVSLCRSLRSRL